MAKANKPQQPQSQPQQPAQPAQPQSQPRTVRPQPASARPQTTTTTATRAKSETLSLFGQRNDKLVFGRETYMWMLIGIAIMAVGFICMSGGAMKDPNVWDESVIYSTTRIVIAPILILLGLGVQVYAIFKKNTSLE